MALTPPQARVRARIHRLIAVGRPTAGIFDSVATPEDARAALLLASWTDDSAKAVLNRLALLPEGQWVVGQPGAQLVMAAFFHPAPGGGRFNAENLGAWYAAREIETAIAETVHHHTRRLRHSAAGFRATIRMRELASRIDAHLHDIRGWRQRQPWLYDPDDYRRSQAFGERLRASGATGIVYWSVRRPTGQNVAIFRPRLVQPVHEGNHYEYRWVGNPEPQVMRLTWVR